MAKVCPLYSDRHSIFQVNPQQGESLEDQLAGGRKPTTQVGRALQELGVQLIVALSPQAKGRIERLWGTFQDRLVSELRLAGATTVEEPTRCCGPSCLVSTPASPCHQPSPVQPIGPWNPVCASKGSCALARIHRWTA